jgi:hypothetical protein
MFFLTVYFESGCVLTEYRFVTGRKRHVCAGTWPGTLL